MMSIFLKPDCSVISEPSDCLGSSCEAIWPQCNLMMCVFIFTGLSVTWCPLCCTLSSPLFSWWCVLLTGVPLLCILLILCVQMFPCSLLLTAYTTCRYSLLYSCHIVCSVSLPQSMVSVFLLNWCVCRYLATSGNPIYRVVALNSTAEGCDRINGSVDCDPQVRIQTHSLHTLSPPVPFHFFLHSFILLSPPRTSPHQITQNAPLPAASSSNTTTRVSSRGTSSTCRSTTWWLSSGVSTSSSPWDSVRWLGPSPPTTGPSPNQMTSPCSLWLPVLYAHSGRLMSCCHTS